MAKVKKEVETFSKERKNLTERLLSHKKKGEINWMLEQTASKKLFTNYPFPEFWDQFDTPFELNSLMSLCSFWGINYVEKQYNYFLYMKNKYEEIEKVELKDKIGETLITNSKPKNLKDFLK